MAFDICNYTMSAHIYAHGNFDFVYGYDDDGDGCYSVVL